MTVNIRTPFHVAYDALVSRLGVVFPVTRFQIDFVPPAINATSWGALLQRAPFVGIAWNDMNGDRDNGRDFQGLMSWSVLLVTRNPKLPGRYLGDAQGIGLFHMMHAAIATLSGHTIDGLGLMEVTAGRSMIGRDWDMTDCVVAQLDVSIAATLMPAGTLDDMEPSGWLREIGIDWTIDGVDHALDDINPVGKQA